MRALLLAIAATVVAGCATTSTGERTAVYDRKYNQFSFVRKAPQSDFVGTGAAGRQADTPPPSWYLRNHP